MLNNILEFFVKMRDLTAPQVKKTVENVRSIERVANNAGRAVQGVSDRIRNMANTNPAGGPATQGIRNLTEDTEKLNRELKKTKDLLDATSDSGGGGGGSGGGGLLGKLLKMFTLLAVLKSSLAFARSSAEEYIKFEANNKSYEVLAGNKGIGQALGADLNALKQNSILGAAVYDNSKTLMSFGMTADKVIPSLKMLGEVSMGNKERFASLTLAFAQTGAAGKLMGQDLLQYVNAGFNPLKEISKMTGESMSSLRKKMEDGAISADMVTKAFEHATSAGGLFHNMLGQMEETTSGKLAKLQGKFTAFKIVLGEKMAPAINSVVGFLTKMVSGMTKMIEVPIERKLQAQINKIHALQGELTASNTSHARQLELLKELEQINPNIVEGIDKQNISYSKLAENINNVTGALRSKIFMERLDKDNADIIAKYANARKVSEDSWVQSMSLVGRFPDLAQNTSLSIGQKQMEAVKRQREIVSKLPGQGITGGGGTGGGSATLHPERDALNTYIQALKANGEANETIKKLQPKINELNATKEALSKQIDQYTGVKSMTAAMVQGGGTGGTGTGGTGTGEPKDDVAKGITGGGPRVININGVTMKVADHLTVTAGSGEDFLQQMEPKMQELFLRILNSGASVQ